MKSDPVEELFNQYGPLAGPLDEINLWETRRNKLLNIKSQLDGEIAADILQNMTKAKSSYAASFVNLKKDMDKVR